MKRQYVTLALIAFVACHLISCTRGIGQDSYSPSERTRIDSIVRSNRCIDSLCAVAGKFAAEGDLLGQAVSYRELGRAYRNAAHYQEAIDAHLKGLEISKGICDTLEMVQALNNIGTAYRRMGVLEEAASWHYQGLSLCELWSDTTSVGLKNRVVSLNGLGNVLLSMGNDSLAMASFREALRGETTLGSLNGMAINYANIGALMEDKGQIDSARYYYGLSLECNTRTGSELGISLCHGHFGRLAEMEGDLETAFDEYGAAYDVLSKGADKWHWLESCTSLARVSMKTGKAPAARRYLSEATHVAEGLGSAAHLADIYHLYYMLDAEAGRFKDSLGWLEKHSECMRRIYDERNEDAIYELRSKYEREKSLNEMRLLQHAHDQKIRRDRMALISTVIILVFAMLAICFLIYSLRLRSRNNKILRDLDQTKNNYFTNIAHEFRTPLTIILSAARSIRRQVSDKEMESDACDIINHSEGLLRLVSQVLGIARMTSNIAPDPVWRRGNLSAFVYGIYERSQRLAREHGITMEYEGDDDLEMDFVPDFIIHVVQNLLSNAIKFSRRGGKVLLCLDKVTTRKGEMARIRVKDWGLGITDEQMVHLWEPFYQVSPSDSVFGTGIGLPLVKRSVEAMNGTVGVTSYPGSGTEFIVEIPVLREACASADPALQPVDTEYAGGSDHEEFCILIVEDNPDVARWQMRQLEGDYRFVSAENGSEGLRLAEEIVPDLIISDVMMPLMDGFEMCRRIRSSELLCHIPIVMVTAKASHEDRLKGLEAGADAYLEKPYDEAELSLRVRMLLEQRDRLRTVFASGGAKDVDGTLVQMPVHTVADRAFLEKFDRILEEAFDAGNVNCEELASSMFIGRVQLNRKLKALTGLKTTEYILQARIARAKELLASTGLTIGEIALRCGMEDVGYFSTVFKKFVGVTPTAYRSSKVTYVNN